MSARRSERWHAAFDISGCAGEGNEAKGTTRIPLAGPDPCAAEARGLGGARDGADEGRMRSAEPSNMAAAADGFSSGFAQPKMKRGENDVAEERERMPRSASRRARNDQYPCFARDAYILSIVGRRAHCGLIT